MLRGLIITVMTAGLGIAAAAIFVPPAGAATLAANIDQCTNGGVGPPLALTPCLNGTLGGTSFSDWVNGNANASKAHWKEGQFISYRTTVTGLTAGTHTLVFNYQTVHGGKHALDYVGSYDATETTSPTASAENRNDNNPCFDKLGTSGCTQPGTPPTPASTLAVPAANLAGGKTCGGASGLATTPAQKPGTFDLFAPTASGAQFVSGSATYVSQNVLSGTGQCSTTMSFKFSIPNTAPAGGWTVVLTWGGHIASALDWGVGNSASNISGSPYHMALDSIDGTSTGSQDRALTAGAVAPLPAVVTQTSKTSIAVGGTLTDTATLTGPNGTVTGTVDFQLCSNTTTGCPQGTGTTFQSGVQLVNGSATSAPFGSNLGPGNYCIGLVYHNDNNSFYSDTYSGSPTGECFTVTKAAPSVTTTLSANPIGVDGSAFDSAKLTGVTSNAGGTVDYRYYGSLAACQADASAFPGTAPSGGTDVSTVTVTNGSVPNSDPVTFPSAGTFYWAAFYSGDANNTAAVSGCDTELLVVNQATPSVTTQLSANPIPVDGTAHDSATLHNASASAGGTVDYRYYGSLAACQADASAFPGTAPSGGTDVGTVTVTNGSVPDSAAVTFPSAGTFYWAAFYSGDANNLGAVSGCDTELLVVNQATPSVTTQLSANPIPVDGTAHDSATLHNASASAGGTVDYRYYGSLAACQADASAFPGTAPSGGTDVSTVTVTNGSVPNSDPVTFPSAGTFYWAAFYSGDANNTAAVSGCDTELLVVNQANPAISTAQQLTPNDNATISGASANAGGTITFNLYGPGDATCSGTPAFTQTVTVSGNGTYHTTNTAFVASDQGTWRWQVIYSGDANNSGTTSACGVENFTIANG